jgi:23S rRNA (uracil1939-C5)-methyltransferase
VTDHFESSPRRPTETVRAERLVAGGAALARRESGSIVLVDGALPGELVEVRVERRSGTERGRMLQILEPSVDRIDPSCPHVLEGCGGCDLASLELPAQHVVKLDLVQDSLRRLGRLNYAVVDLGPTLEPWSFRTTLRMAVIGGRAGLRMAESHDVVGIDHCAVAHPLLNEMIVEGRFGAATEVMFRVGARTGERMAVVTPTAAGVKLPGDVLVVGADELAAGRRAWIHEEVAGRRWRISAESFFQTRADGAEALVGVVRTLAADVLDSDDASDAPRTLLDAYCGVGLFAGSLLDGRAGWRAVAAERSRSSVADARQNLGDLEARVVGTSIERLRAPRADLVVADPSRSGLGRAGVKVLASADAPVLILVSCDPAAAGRDAALLASSGYRAVRSLLVDLFPHTHHTELVSRFEKASD